MFTMALFHLMVMVSVVMLQSITAANVPDSKAVGGEPTKAYYFPWLTSIHRVTRQKKEFFGSGSIIARRWVIGSMDCFIRKSIQSKRPYYQELASYLLVFSGNIWGEPYQAEGSEFIAKRRVTRIHFFSDPDLNKATVLKLEEGTEAPDLKSLKRSPFGFSMNVALLHLDENWQWKKNTLPIPLYSPDSNIIKTSVANISQELEAFPHQFSCYVAGWRMGDKRMIQYEVVYVPHKQCEAIYCAYDPRACMKWPVEGVHGCFKSLFYTDLCWRDQGTALYCEHFDRSILAVLTSAPTCGYGGLPGVYTWISVALTLFEKASGYTYEPLTDLSQFLPPSLNKLFKV